VDSDKSRQSTVRGTIEPQKIVYGEALVSGPVVFVGVSGTRNEDLHHVVALAGHEVESITDIYLDSEIIVDPFGAVTTGTFGPVGGTTICRVDKYLGTEDQAADSVLSSTYGGYNSNHRGRGIAYIHTTFTLTDASQELWDKYSPNNIKALVRGKKVYDPRLDVTPGADPTNAAYIAYSDNPALCIADYLINTRFGMKVSAAKIVWSEVVTAADICDLSVNVPGGTEKRFTANGVLFATDTHKDNIAKLLSAMNGKLIYTAGKYVIRAGAYVAPTETLTDDDLTGPIGIKTSVERSDRFNTVGGVYINPADGHKSAEFPQVTTTAALLRDNNEVLEKEIELPFTNSSYMAQRIANKMVQMSDQQKMVTFPANLAGLRVAVGDRVNISVSELGWSNKVFQCLGWSFGDDAGVTLTLMEDDAASYADMAVDAYSIIRPNGVIVNGFPGVPDPQNLTATASIGGVELNWTNPGNSSKFSSIIVYASPTSAWAGAVEIGRGLATTFYHSAATAADPITSGDTRYYWVQAITSGGELSDRNPDSDVSDRLATALTNIADSVEWVDVGDGGGLRPSNNATVGAQASVDLKNAAGTVLVDADVLNSVVIEDITQIQLAGTGEILELIGGGSVDLQQLGDVAAYAYNADQVLNGYINGLNSSFGNLQDTLGDITAGVADVYVQATAPVAGVGGVPDPIPVYSRWYDSDDSNRPNYWNGTTWIDLSDPRIAQNNNEIVANNTAIGIVDGRLTTAEANVVIERGRITAVIDDLAITDAGFSSLLGRYDSFEQDYIDNDIEGLTLAHVTAIDGLLTSVSENDGLLEVASTARTALAASIEYYTVLVGSDGDPLEFVGGGEIDLQGTSAVGGATGTAVSVLDTRVVETERGISVNSSSIVVLGAAIAATNTNVAGSATAIDDLSVVVELQGDIITAKAEQLLELSTDVGENFASIGQQIVTTNGLSAQYAIKIDNNGRAAGFGLSSTLPTDLADPAFSEFVIIADRFAVVNPDLTSETPIVPFQVTAGKIYMGTDVVINGDLITAGSISADYINIDGVTLDTDGSGNLIIAGNGVGTGQIAPSAVTIDELADSIQSTDYVTGVSGWKITKDGESEFSNVTVRGNVDAGSISINGDYLSVVGGELTVTAAPNTEVTAASESSGSGTSSVTINRVTGGVTTIQVNVRIFETRFGTYSTPFPATLTLKRGATVIATYAGIQGEWEPGDGAGEPAVAAGSFGATFFDADTGTGSTTYNLTCSTSSFSTTFQIIAKSTIP